MTSGHGVRGVWLARIGSSLLASFALAACGVAGTSPDAGLEAGLEGGADAHVDGGACVDDPDCTDHVFCNGVEHCAPGATGADARGCVAAAPASPCLAGQTC